MIDEVTTRLLEAARTISGRELELRFRPGSGEWRLVEVGENGELPEGGRVSAGATSPGDAATAFLSTVTIEASLGTAAEPALEERTRDLVLDLLGALERGDRITNEDRAAARDLRAEVAALPVAPSSGA